MMKFNKIAGLTMLLLSALSQNTFCSEPKSNESLLSGVAVGTLLGCISKVWCPLYPSLGIGLAVGTLTYASNDFDERQGVDQLEKSGTPSAPIAQQMEAKNTSTKLSSIRSRKSKYATK